MALRRILATDGGRCRLKLLGFYDKHFGDGTNRKL